MKKNCLFQYATKQEIIEDTGLITMNRANDLVHKYLGDLKYRWDELQSPQMVVWVKCKNETDYHTMAIEIDYMDCVLENGHFYKIEKKKII